MDKEQSTTNEEDLDTKRLNTADTFDSLERQSCDESRRSNFARHHEVSLHSVTDFVDHIEVTLLFYLMVYRKDVHDVELIFVYVEWFQRGCFQ